jgi:hypothetical protein
MERSLNASVNSNEPEIRFPVPLPHHCNVEDIPGFQSLIGDAAEIPPDGLIQFRFCKNYLESKELSEAIQTMKDLEQFVQLNKESGISLKFSS